MNPIRRLDLHLTHRCNLRCSYCYAGRAVGDLPPDLSPELADAAVDFLLERCGESPRIRVDLWGGEPLLRRDLIERIAARARAGAARLRKQLAICIPTNLTLLDARARRLADDRDLSFSLSLDGGPEAQAARRTAGGQQSWQLVEPRLREVIAESGGRLPPVRMTVTPDRSDHLAADLSFFLERGFRQISFLPASGVPWTADATERLDRQFDLVADELAAWIRSGRPAPPYYPHLLRRLTVLWVRARSGTAPRRAGYCGAGTTLLAVDTRGNLYPCHRVVAQAQPPAALRLGSLGQGVTNLELRDRLAALSADQPGVRCATCGEREGCGALCPALNFRVAGDIARVPDEACFVNRRLARAAARIHDSLRDEPRYRDYIEPFLYADPDERMLPLLAALESNREALVDQVSARLENLGKKEEE